MDIEQVFCIYCKQTIDKELELNYHPECKKLIQKYNKKPFIKFKNEFRDNKITKRSVRWLYYRNMTYKSIYAIGGINIAFIILLKILFGF